MRSLLVCVALSIAALCAGSAMGGPVSVPNAGFETCASPSGIPDGWAPSIGGEAKVTIGADDAVRHSGARSLHISNESPVRPFVWGGVTSGPIKVKPATTYVVSVWAKGESAGSCHLGVAFDGGGEHRMYLPNGSFDWRRFSSVFTTPDRCSSLSLRVLSEDVTKGLWADDVELAISSVQAVNIRERRSPRGFEGIFPRTPGRPAERLTVCDVTAMPADVQTALFALQGIANRKSARIYLISNTGEHGGDEVWLRYMQEKGYTGRARRVTSAEALLRAYRRELSGAVIYDPKLPGSIAAAISIAGIENALPVTAELAERFGLPTVMDLRGRWTRNVDAYRFVYSRYWDKMRHNVLAWRNPVASPRMTLDYIVEFNIPSIWISKYGDPMPGADPAAEEEFANEILAATPGNVPVLGWPTSGDGQGLTEYQMVRLCSEFGKFVPGTEFSSNLSVHTAIRPPESAFIRRNPVRPDTVKADPEKTYIALNLLESGDALWYWSLYQREIWADPMRGRTPTNWCMNVSLYDATPVVTQWYYENATPNDTFFAAVSGLGYMNAPVYACRFRREDRERILREYVQLTDYYCRKLGITGVSVFTDGATPERIAPFLRHFTTEMKGLDFIVNDFTRFDAIDTRNANYMLDGAAVFHTLTKYHIWQTPDEPGKRKQADEVKWVLDEITANTPKTRPSFMSAMVISWNFFPSWITDLADRLPERYEPVTLSEMARLFREQQRAGASTAR